MKPNLLILLDTGIIGGPGKGIFQLIDHYDQDRLSYLLCNFSYPANDEVSSEFNDHAQSKDYNFRKIISHGSIDFKAISQVCDAIKENRCNVIQSHGYKAHTIALIAAKRTGIKWISCSHGFTNENFKVRAYNWLEKNLVRFSQHAIAVSRPLLKTIKQQRSPNKTSEYIPNAVSIPKRAEPLRNTREGEYWIGTVGRLSPEKGHHILIEAFAASLTEMPNLRLIIVGQGPEEVALQALITRLGLAEKISLKGYTNDIESVYARLNLFVLPSLSEGIPNVLLEAMAFQIPCIATSVGSVPDVLDHNQSGILVPPNNSQALAKAIIQLANSGPDRINALTSGAIEKLDREFSPKVRANRFMAAYELALLDDR